MQITEAEKYSIVYTYIQKVSDKVFFSSAFKMVASFQDLIHSCR